MTYYIIEESTTYRTDEQAKKRDALQLRLIGELDVEPLAEVVAVVERRTGIRPPAWFNTRGVTLSQVNAIGAAGRARR